MYLAAFMPVAGRTPMEEMLSATSENFGQGIKSRDDGLLEMDVDHAIKVALQQAPPTQVELLRANLGKPMSFGTDPAATLTAAAWESPRPTSFVRTT